ncbi:hypothetical protein P43SY_000216 [Pythium insidiosum]|uniref:m7GpppX diphosphatase n=1 Tax=Pythium insidiosum TaxID=114742 RepID=A0AAD5M843_PYTIN|nr:hypothetical protein P43SY_000216 [Pythium insidiosum]
MAAAATAAALTPSAGARRPSTPTAATPATTANTANNDMEPATITPASPALRVGDLFWKQDGPSGWVLGQLMAHDAVARTARFSLVDEATGELLDEAAHPPMTLQLDESPLFAANPLFTTAADMTSLRHLHEAALAKNLEDRSSQQNQRPYTFMANVLIAVNPLKHLEEPDKNIFTAQSLDRCPPHPYYIAENAYRQLCAVRAVMQNQSIIISGESGSGKTETSKIILDFLTTRAKRTSRAPSCASEDDMMEPELTPRVVPLNESVTQAPRSDTGALSFPLSARGGSAIKLSPVALGERLMETIPILESFGNAKTHRNHNSSRFGKYMRLQFTNSTHELSGASIDTYLLEKSRLVSQPTGERNFHVFYELLYSKDESYLRDALFLSPKDPESYSYLNQSGCLKASELIDDAENFRSLCKALEFVGIYEAGQHEIFRIVAGLLHLGNVTISEEDTSEGKTACIAEGDIASQQALERASELLGVTKQELNECIFYKRIMTLAKTIYEHVFTWLMVQCASALDYDAARSDVIPYIGVLDIFGFEDFEPKNRNSFEQLLINYANEALQSLFNACIFEAEQVLYRSEHIYAPTNHSMSFPFPLPGVPLRACEVLRVGLPTRILYAEVVDVYKNILPFDMFQKFDYNEKLFTQAILWVYNFPTSAYRLGDTRLFFRTGKIDLLDKLLTPSTQKIDPANLASQMLLYLRKKRWIGAATKIMVYNAFKEIYYECKYRRKAITIQCMIKVFCLFRRELQRIHVVRLENDNKSLIDAVRAAEEKARLAEEELSRTRLQNKQLEIALDEKTIHLAEQAKHPAQHAAVLTIHRTAFDTSDMMELLRSLSLHVILENDIYSTYLGDVSRDMKPYKVSLIHPATDAHIRKHTDQAFHMVVETKQVYDEITEPFIASLPKEKIEWVYNILDHKTESERIIFEDADPVTGFILIPDFKWSDVTNLESIYCLAIVHDRSIRSLRDLRGKHLELLRNLREKSLRALQEQFGVLPSAFRIYVHYQPTYYHFHIHFSHVKLTEGTHTGKAVLLDNIIYNLSIDGDYYANADLAMVVGELQHQQLFERFVEHATTRRSQSTGDRGTVALPSPAKRGIAKPRFSRYLLVGFAIFQCFLGAGVVFGWTSILPMLEKERIYNELCKPDESFCEAQSVQLHFAFTIAASSSMFANLFLGILFDKYGPRISKLVSLVILMVGAIMMGRARVRTTASSSFDFFLPGMAFMAFGGTGLQLCSVHLSNLFPEAKSLVTCFMVGALQLSFFIFAIFAVLYDNFGLSQRAIFNGYTAILGVSLLGTVVLSPDKPYQLDSFARLSTESSQSTAEPEHELLSPIRLPSVFKKGETSLLLGTPHMNKEQLPTHVPPMALPARAAAGSASLERAIRFANDAHDYKSRSFKTQVLSPPFLLLTLLFSIGTLWCNYFLGSVTAQLRRKPLSAADVTTLMNDFGLLLPGGVVFIPLVGYLLEIWGHMRVTFATCLVSVAFTMCFFGSDHVGVLVLSFVLYTLYRTALFALLFSYIGHTFGFKNFGVLSGIAFSVAAVVGLLQTPLTEIPDFRVVGGIQLGTLLLSFALPIYDLVVTQRGRL